MKITVTTNAKAIETVNYILSCALDSLRNNPQTLKHLDLKESDIEISETFKRQLLNVSKKIE